MHAIDRRRFLRTGALGMGATLGAPGAALGQTPGSRLPGSESTRVRMFGDGVGLTPEGAADLWTRLAREQSIVPDSYSNGGSVEELERQLATLLGKERAVFMPTSTLANHLAIRALSGGAGRAIVQAESHIYNDSGDCVQTLSNINLVPLAPGRATCSLDEVKDVIARTDSGRVATPVSVISIEAPVRRRSGETFDEAEMERIATFARSRGIRLHLDGARLFLQSAYTGRSVADYAAPFDTVYVSLYKYFNAASGAILAGPRALLDEMFHTRRMFGAGLPGAWPFASIAAYYLTGFTERFRKAIAVSESWIEQIGAHDAFSVERIPSGTNLFRLRVSQADLEGFRRRVRTHGVDLSTPRADGSGFLLGVNETWNRQTADVLAGSFVAALSG